MAVAFAALATTEGWRTVELKGFDALTVATAPNASRFPITIIGIDEPSFAEVGRQWPWPRSLYGKLVDTLAREGAIVIAFDLVLTEPDRGGPAEDEALAAAIKRAGNVVLAADQAYIETAYARQWMRVDPLPVLREAGAVTGFARIELDRDATPRRIPLEQDAFWRRIAALLARQVPDVQVQDPPPGSMIRYAGPILTFQYVSFYQALDPAKLPPGLFKDQVVIIGRHVQVSTEAGAINPDVFFTPFTASTGWSTPGAEIHAHILETALRGDAVRPVGPAWIALLIVAVLALCAALLPRMPLRWGALLVAGLAGLLSGVDVLLFARADLWLPVGAPIAAMATLYLAYGGMAFLVERRRRAELRHAFSLYVSPEVVDHVMAQPERLALGGEYRDVTLLFTDLAGFTNITEKLGAEEVTRILNQHFTGATGIIKRHHGTVNRFIGDAVMAMWGAPLEDPDQALHAVEAAIELQADVARLRAELVAAGRPPIAMRVGIHSDRVIVGNLGASDRLDYTAIGDGVNLAARLEGVNKLYGTGILVSGATAARVGGRLALRPVDRVVVKGKTEPVEIFTPCDDPALLEASTRAVAAFRDRRWDESAAAWREALALAPDDRIATLYLERIERLRLEAPGPGWNAAVELEKL